MNSAATDEILPLVRRWAVDWICGHRALACDELLAPDYRLRIGDAEFVGRDAYQSAASQQFSLFPGLMLTAHDVLTNGKQAALRFTEHGASLKHGGRAAAWAGVALLEGAGGRLTRCWANENYYARRRQLAGGTPAEIPSPAVAPWDTPAEPADADTEAVVRSWILTGLPAVEGVVFDDEASVPHERVMNADRGETEIVVSAGRRAAFHGRLHGAAVGNGLPVSMSVSGMVVVIDGAVRSGTVITDRLGVLSAARTRTR